MHHVALPQEGLKGINLQCDSDLPTWCNDSRPILDPSAFKRRNRQVYRHRRLRVGGSGDE